MEESGVSEYSGVLIHDFWKAYYKIEGAEHGLCNAHILRELKALQEIGEDWAYDMEKFLLKANNLVKANLDYGNLPKGYLEILLDEYEDIIFEGLSFHNSLPELYPKSSGRKKQRTGKNLLDRFTNHRREILRFIYDFDITFTNNLAERDIRMTKLKMKISGCFRTKKGADIFCSIRSYLSTAKKQGWNILETIHNALNGNPNLLLHT